MLQARKSNKVYTVDEKQADAYAAAGYDIYDGNKLVKHAVGKTVPIAEHEKALVRIAELEKQLKAKKAKDE